MHILPYGMHILPYGTHLIIHASPTEGAARAEPSLLELCRVVTEEDEVNQRYPLTRDFVFYGKLDE